ncbi:hypothetical protein [Actinomadura atramentaria]|uniref:hypothetical protein n=1 Tax=Actinomadura atramentaria TaxID=1990 RepID=UPI00035EFE9B|nr:hypothetical protein [Actinomadura atramentaria]
MSGPDQNGPADEPGSSYPVTAGGVARLMWLRRPSLAEIGVALTLVALADLVLGFPVLAGLATAAALVVVIGTASAVADLVEARAHMEEADRDR